MTILALVALLQAEPIRLFNGRDLSGLTTWLKESGREDPKRVFRVTDGMLHATGEDSGYVATAAPYRDYRLVVEYKWGARTDGGKYVRNSGILLHAAAADGTVGPWTSSVECQLAQGCVGDFIVIRGKDDKRTITADTAPGPDKRPRWKPGGTPTVWSGKQIWWKDHDPEFKELIDTRGRWDVESAKDEWTRVEVECAGNRIGVSVNGTLVNECYDANPASGRILLQSEGFEIFFRTFELHPLPTTHSTLLAEARKHFEARRQAVAALKTPEDVERRRDELRAKFMEAIGGFPERTPLKARDAGAYEIAGIRVEKVVYESRPDHPVTALFYKPAGDGPFPGVLMPMGHSAEGKAADYAQRGSILLAKNGIAVLCYDPIGQGERRQIPSAKLGSTTEHTLAGVGALLVGRSTASYRIWDAIRSLDYLAGRPDVDPKRLGCTGCSGGGTLTSYLMALDDRVLAAAPSCYITTLERLFETIGPQDAEQNIPGQVAFGMDHPDYVTMRAPRPTLLLAATQDFFDIGGTWDAFREAKRVYGVMGHAERMELAEFDTKHGFPRPQREAATRFFRRWLLNVDDAPVEPEFPIATIEQTHAAGGQVQGRTVFDFNADVDRAARRGPPREARRLLAIADAVPAAAIEERGAGRFEFTTEPGIVVRGGGTAKPETLAVGGPGDLSIEPRAGDFKEAFLSMHVGRPLLGRRVHDVLAVIEATSPRRLTASASWGPVGLHAALLSPRIEEVVIEGSIVSWSAVVHTPLSVNQLNHVVPGVLLHYDLTGVAAALAPRPLTIRGPVDPAGKPLTQEQIDAAFASVREAYRKAGAENKLRLVP